MIKEVRATLTAWKHRVLVRFGLHRHNTLKLRRRIRAARKSRRFFQYLCAVKPFLPIGMFAPWAGLLPNWQRIDGLTLDSAEATMRVIIIALVSLLFGLQIIHTRNRFKRQISKSR